MRLESKSFADGATIPRRFTCDGEDISPPLKWSDAPPQTKSFVLLCDDPDVPTKAGRHWAVYDISGKRRKGRRIRGPAGETSWGSSAR
jgi:phosphatidylethanolamine-binding protein (PEBP) family uncharacterized protein